MLEVELSEIAEKHLAQWKRKAPPTFNKIMKLILESAKTPGIGTGKPHRLKHKIGEIWSREINKKDRLVYEVLDESKLIVWSALGHYSDK